MSRNVSILSVMVMMTVMVMATVTVAFATPNEPQNEGSNGQTKVTICHKGHTITVGEPAVAAHGRHGDNITGPCGDEPQPEPTLVLTTQATQEVTLGQPISDTATLSGGDNPTGTITFNVYGPDDEDCSGEPAITSVVDVNGNGDYSSDPTPNDLSDDFVPEAAGTYRWTAEYSGDDNNDAVTSACNAENEASVVTEDSTMTPELTTQATSATLGQPISDTATLSGATSDATGTINFKLYGPFTGNDATQDACTADKLVFQTFPSPQTPTDVSIVGTRDAQTGNYIVTSPEYTPTAVGRYQWVVSYSGDANNGAVSSECNAPNEASVVTQATATSTTEQNLTASGWNGKAAKPAKATKLAALTWAGF